MSNLPTMPDKKTRPLHPVAGLFRMLGPDEVTELPQDIADAALAALRAGRPVFPCRPGGKEPLLRNGFLGATLDEELVRRWWAVEPTANVAMPTGTFNGLTTADVLDVDVRPAGTGWELFNRAKRAGLLTGAVAAVSTPSGGLHLHFPGTERRSSSLRGRFLDFKATGGYVLLPGSHVVTDAYTGSYVELERREHGKALDWPRVVALLDPPPPPRPAPLGRAGRGGGVAALARWVAGQGEGNRNRALFWAACKAADAGIDDLEVLIDAARGAGLSEQAARRTVESARNPKHRRGVA